MTERKHTIDAYNETSGKFRQFLDSIEGSQPGDPKKAAEAMIQVVESEQPPLRFVLGKYAYSKFREKIKSLTTELDTWEAIGANTDFTS